MSSTGGGNPYCGLTSAGPSFKKLGARFGSDDCCPTCCISTYRQQARPSTPEFPSMSFIQSYADNNLPYASNNRNQSGFCVHLSMYKGRSRTILKASQQALERSIEYPLTRFVLNLGPKRWVGVSGSLG